MRIIIDIEGTETTAVQTPPEAIAAVTAIGAIDAGPAPDIATQSSGVPPIPFSITGPSAPVAGASDLPAGAAPLASLSGS